MTDLLIILPYTAVSLSMVARFIFMYLLYTKTSTNIYSLTFCYLSVASSCLWIPYGVLLQDTPIVVRSSVEIVLLSLSALYIHRNRCRSHSVKPLVRDLPPSPTHCPKKQISVS
jgi:lipid-A-disaccharide synthase-like uncharacterized protein